MFKVRGDQADGAIIFPCDSIKNCNILVSEACPDVDFAIHAL